jgi:hypothetical protein
VDGTSQLWIGSGGGASAKDGAPAWLSLVGSIITDAPTSDGSTGWLNVSPDGSEWELLPVPIPPDQWTDHDLWGHPGDRWWNPSHEWPGPDLPQPGALPDGSDAGGFVDLGDPRNAPESTQPDFTTLASDKAHAVLQILSSLRYTPGNARPLTDSQPVTSADHQRGTSASFEGNAAVRDSIAGSRRHALAAEFTDVVQESAARGEQSEGGMVVLLPDVLGVLSTASAAPAQDANQALLETPARMGAARGRFQAFEVSTAEPAAAPRTAESGDSAAIPRVNRGEWPGEGDHARPSQGPAGSADRHASDVADFEANSTASESTESLAAALAEWRAGAGSIGELLVRMAQSTEPVPAADVQRRSPLLPFVASVLVGFVAMSAHNWGIGQTETIPRLNLRRKTARQ